MAKLQSPPAKQPSGARAAPLEAPEISCEDLSLFSGHCHLILSRLDDVLISQYRMEQKLEMMTSVAFRISGCTDKSSVPMAEVSSDPCEVGVTGKTRLPPLPACDGKYKPRRMSPPGSRPIKRVSYRPDMEEIGVNSTNSSKDSNHSSGWGVSIQNPLSPLRPTVVATHSEFSNMHTTTTSTPSRARKSMILAETWPASIKLRNEFDATMGAESSQAIRNLLEHGFQNGILYTLSHGRLSTMNLESSENDFAPGYSVHTDVPMRTLASVSLSAKPAEKLPGHGNYVCVVSPSSKFRLVLDLMCLIALAFDMFAKPFYLAWDLPENYSKAARVRTSFVVSCLFWMHDMIWSFRTGFFARGELELRFSKIARHYLKTWFFLDLALVCSDVLTCLVRRMDHENNDKRSEMLESGSYTWDFWSCVRLLDILGFLRMAKLAGILDRVSQSQTVESCGIVAQTIPLLFVVLGVSHWMSCAWYAVGRYAPADTGRHWLDDLAVTAVNDRGSTVMKTYADAPRFYQYATSFHWSLTQMTPGSMQVFPANTWERIYNNFCLIVGVIFFSSLISMITAKMTQVKAARQTKSNDMKTLRRFLSQGEFPKELRVAVLKQIQSRMSTPKLLTMSDVVSLDLLSQSMRMELRYELCKSFMSHHPFFFLVDLISSTIMRRVCKDAIDLVVIAAGDSLFLAGTDADSAYVLRQGRLSYVQDPELSMVIERQKTILDAGSQFLCEVALWSHWVHVGTMEGEKMSEIVVINARTLSHVLNRHDVIWELAHEYANMFHMKLTNSSALDNNLPSDIQNPFQDYSELFYPMDQDIKVFISTMTLDLMQQSTYFAMMNRKVISDLREEVNNGGCTLGLDDNHNVMRVVAVTALRVRDSQGRIFAHVGKVVNGVLKPRCQLPGAMQRNGDTPENAIAHIIPEKLSPPVRDFSIVGRTLEIDLKDSVSYKVPTKYLKTIFSAVLCDGTGTLESQHSSSGQGLSSEKARRHSRRGTASLNPAGSLLRSSPKHSHIRRSSRFAFALSFSVRSDNGSELPTHSDVTITERGDTTYLGAWISKSLFDYLSSSAGEAALHRWLKGLQIPADEDTPKPSIKQFFG